MDNIDDWDHVEGASIHDEVDESRNDASEIVIKERDFGFSPWYIDYLGVFNFSNVTKVVGVIVDESYSIMKVSRFPHQS